MKLKPQKWSHHHTHRMYHMSVAVCFLMIVSVLASGIVLTRFQALADTVVGSGTVTITATVGEIIETPAEPVFGGGGTVFVPTEIPSDLPLSITVVPSGIAVKQLPSGLWEFSESNVEFKGTSNLPGALVVGDVTGGNTKIKFKVRVGDDGSWWWRSSEALPNGDYKVGVALVNNQDEIKASASLLFSVNSPSVIKAPDRVPISDLGPDFNLGDLDFHIIVPPAYKISYAGQRFATSIRIKLNKKFSNKVDAKLNFVVSNESGIEFLNSQEKISLTESTLLLKGFYTSLDMPSGNYLVTATLNTPDGQLSSSDSVIIKPPAPLSLFSLNSPSSQRGEYIILSLLFIFFSGLFILELRHVRRLTELVKEHGMA